MSPKKPLEGLERAHGVSISDSRVELYQRIVETAHQGICVLDAEGRMVFANRRMAEMLGYEPEEMLGIHVLEFVSESLHDVVRSKLGRRRSGISEQVPLVYIRKDGSLIHVRVSASPLFEEEGNYEGGVAFVNMASDWHQIEETFQKLAVDASASTGQAYFQALAVSLCHTLDMDYALVGELEPGEELRVRTVAVSIAGETSENLVYRLKGTPCENVTKTGLCVYPDSVQEKFPDDHLLVEMGVEGYVGTPLIASDGSVLGLIAVLSKSPIQEQTLVMDGLQIVGARASSEMERRQSERALEENQSKLAAVLAAVPDLLLIADRDGRYLDAYTANPALRADPPENIIGKTNDELFEPEVARRFGSWNRQIIDEGGIRTFEYEIEADDGTRWFSAAGSPMQYRGESCAVWIVRDISHERSLEQQARARQEQLESFFRAAPEGLTILDDEGNYLLINENLAAANGRSVEDHDGLNIADVVPEEIADILSLIRRVVESDEPLMDFATSHEIPGQPDKMKDLQSTIFPVTLDKPGKKGVGIIVKDVTEQKEAERARKQLELQLLQAQKMESVGQLAGGVAHDFNNLLLAILSYSELAAKETAPDSKAAHYLLEITQAGERAAELTRQLLAFGRRQVIQLADVDLNQLIHNQVRLLHRLFPAHIELDFRPAETPVMASVDPGQFEQVVMNLCLNARDAMTDGGNIRIETSVATPEQEVLEKYSWLQEQPYAQVLVSDDGFGMAPEVADRAFEPFFTTKEQGAGTGLGLAMVYGIIRQHEGAIRLDSTAGIGSSLRLLLPLGESTSTSTDRPGPADACGGDETILVAEDEPMVRDLVVTILTGAGYQVTTADDGVEAIEAFESNPKGFDLVLLDVVMPRLGGVEVHDRIRALRPDTRILFTSGYSAEAFPEGFTPGMHHRMIPKPYRAQELLSTLRQMLDSPTG